MSEEKLMQEEAISEEKVCEEAVSEEVAPKVEKPAEDDRKTEKVVQCGDNSDHGYRTGGVFVQWLSVDIYMERVQTGRRFL